MISKTLSGAGIAHRLEASADDPGQFANGSDATRVAFRVVDEYGNVLKLCSDPLQITISGPADIIGPSLVALSGGTVSVWIRAKRQVGVARLGASHPVLRSKEVEINITAVRFEIV